MDSEIQFKRKTLWLNVLSTSQRSLPLEISAEKICWLHLKAIMQLFQFRAAFFFSNRSLREGRSCAWLKETILGAKLNRKLLTNLTFEKLFSNSFSLPWIVHAMFRKENVAARTRVMGRNNNCMPRSMTVEFIPCLLSRKKVIYVDVRRKLSPYAKFASEMFVFRSKLVTATRTMRMLPSFASNWSIAP